MKLSHLLALMGTVPSFIHAADYKKYAVVVLMGPDAARDEMSVFAKKFSEGEKSEMRVSPGREPWCLGIPDPITNICSEPEYVGITDIFFDRPTTKPRPVEVRFKDYTIEVSVRFHTGYADETVHFRIEPGDGRASRGLERSP
jgi:hypothetical protein